MPGGHVRLCALCKVITDAIHQSPPIKKHRRPTR
jgi:hypothetical protein